MNEYKIVTFNCNIKDESEPWTAFICPKEDDPPDYYASNCGWMDQFGTIQFGPTEHIAVSKLFLALETKPVDQEEKERLEIFKKNSAFKSISTTE